MKFDFLKNYFKIFFISYFIIIFTKFIFTFYLDFSQVSFSSKIYAIFWGYKFDFAASAILSFLATIFDFSKRSVFIVAVTLLVAMVFLQIGDIFYFNESSRHIGYEITDAFTDAKSLFMTALSQYTLLTLASFFFVFFIYVIVRKVEFKEVSFSKSYIFKKIVLIVLTIFFVRGMTQHIPLNPWQSNQIGDTKLSCIALNPTYNIIYSLANKSKNLKVKKLPYLSQEVIEKSLKQLYKDKKIKNSYPIIKTKPNIIFFFLESWSAKYLKPYGFSKQTTPNFDALLKKSIRPSIMIAGGHRTTEGMFCTLVSWQNPLGKSIAKTQLQDFNYTSIIDILNKNGYSSAFFQGTSKETSGTGSLAQSLGFKLSFGKRDIKKRIYKENYWGVHDVDLYNFVEKKLSTTLKEPFVLGINGTTTHDNVIPDGINKREFVEDKNLNDQLNAFAFSDYALGKFIKEIEKKYPNTIFVLFADHCGGNIKGSLENYQIPFAIYSKLIKPKKYDVILSQRDIAPTVYDLVIGDFQNSNLPWSGKSLISNTEFFADFYHHGILGWIEDGNLTQIDLSKSRLRDDVYVYRAISFTKISQKLLFENKIDQFRKYRKISHE